MKYSSFVCICALLVFKACGQESFKRAAADRKITDFGYTNLTEGQVIAAWGPPDAYTDYAGTNDFFWVYCVGKNEQWMAFKTEPPDEKVERPDNYQWHYL